MDSTFQEQLDEIEALKSVYEDSVDSNTVDGRLQGSLRIELEPLSKPTTLISTSNGVEKRVTVKGLSPVTLFFQLPPDYPSTSAPVFEIEAEWISEEMVKSLHSELIATCEENLGMPLLFLCYQKVADFVQENEADLLEIHLENTPYGIKHSLSSDELLRRIEKSNEKSQDRVFNNNCFDCEVCFENKMGTDCVRFVPCDHVFCKECVSAFFMERLNGLQVRALECLNDDCDSIPSEAVIKEAVGQVEFDRYERILLERALGQMEDVVNCARQSCQKPVILSQANPALGSCGYCGFSFCVVCKKAYHALEDCSFKALDRASLIEKFENSNEAERVEMARKFGGLKRLQRIIDNLQNETWIDGNSRPCPKCKAHIEKDNGCNKMHCTKCDTSFCWLCNKVLDPSDPYAHFNPNRAGRGGGGCLNRLFEGVVVDDIEEIEIDGEWELDEEFGMIINLDGDESDSEDDLVQFVDDETSSSAGSDSEEEESEEEA